MWPWRASAAYALSAVLVVVLVGAVVWVDAVDLLDEQASAWWYLLAVLLGLLPVVLVFLDFAAANRATLDLRYVSVDFAGAATAATPAPASVSPNIIGAAQPADSGLVAMRAVLDVATAREVVEVDLGDGDAWWPTRLLVLAAGVAWGARPGVIAFVADDADAGPRFLGWAHPDDVRDRLLARDERFRAAWAATHRRYHAALAAEGQYPWPVWQAATASAAGDWTLVDHAREIVLMEELTPLEPPDHGITPGDLERVVGPVLHRATLDTRLPEAEQHRTILATAAPYVGVVDERGYRGLVATAQLRGQLVAAAVGAAVEA